MEISTTVAINAPMERGWPLLDGDANSDAVDARRGGNDVSGWKAHRLLEVRVGDERHFATDVVYRLSEQGSVTRLDYACQVEFKSWLARIMIFVGAPMIRRIVKRHMANLKRVAVVGASA